MEYQAELRIYQPLTGFDDAVAGHISRARGRTRAEVETLSAQRAEARTYASATNPFPPTADDELVRVLRVKVPGDAGEPAGYSDFFCPEELALRTELAAEQLEQQVPELLFNLVVPEEPREENLARLLSGDHPTSLNPDVETQRVHTRAAVWGIPMPWFALFGESARPATETQLAAEHADQVITGTHPHTGLFTARQITPLALAIERARKGAATVSLRAPDWDILNDFIELVTWLEGFHPDSYVELDYGGLARFVWPDDSVFDAVTVLHALDQQDTSTAMIANQRLMRRWLEVRQRGRAS